MKNRKRESQILPLHNKTKIGEILEKRQHNEIIEKTKYWKRGWTMKSEIQMRRWREKVGILRKSAHKKKKLVYEVIEDFRILFKLEKDYESQEIESELDRNFNGFNDM